MKSRKHEVYLYMWLDLIIYLLTDSVALKCYDAPTIDDVYVHGLQMMCNLSLL